MNKKLVLILGAIILIGGGFFAAKNLYLTQKADELKTLAGKDFKLFVPDHAVRMGAEKPKVYIVEFLDPECESCRMIAPYVKNMMKEFGDRAQLVIRYAPFHGNSQYAAAILEAARMQGKYWETLELLFETQPHWGDHHNPQPERIWTFLPSLGLDIERLKKDMMDPSIVKILQQDIADLQVLEVRRTPSFFVNGKPLEKFGPSYLRELIENELEASK